MEAVRETEDRTRAQASALAPSWWRRSNLLRVHDRHDCSPPAPITRSKQAWTQPNLQQSLVIGVDRGRVLDHEKGVLLELGDFVVGLGALALNGLRGMTGEPSRFQQENVPLAY